MESIDLNGYYGGLRQYIGELPETMIYSMVWKENMKKVNKEYDRRVIRPPGSIAYFFLKNPIKKEKNIYYIVPDNERFFIIQSRDLENESLTDLEELNSSEMSEAMQQTWNYDDLDKQDHYNSFITINFGYEDLPQYDPDDPYYANKYSNGNPYESDNLKKTGKMHKLPKRYRYSSGKDSMYGYKDCECFLCWDRKMTFKNRIKEFESIHRIKKLK